MKNTAKRSLPLLLALLLAGSALALSACGGSGEGPETQAAGTSASTEAATEAPADTLYTVSVQNGDGTPASDIILKLSRDGEVVATKVIGPTGSATATLPAGEYTVTLEKPDGSSLHYDTEARLTPEAPSLTLTIRSAATATETIQAPSLKGGEYVRHHAFTLGEGETYVALNSAEYTYFIFTPTRGGLYAVTCGDSVVLSYRGNGINVFDYDLIETVDGVVTLPVHDSSIGEGETGTARYVFAIQTTAASESGVAVSITRTGDVPKTPADEPWVVLTATESFLHPYEGELNGRFTDLDVTDPSLSVVLNETDGYYHLGTADGPLVFIRLTEPSPYMDAFETVCEKSRMCRYFYDENGSFLRKESYNEVVTAYIPFCNADGATPLTRELAYVMQNTGEQNGWWNFSDGVSIFGDKAVPAEIGWLFACGYYK